MSVISMKDLLEAGVHFGHQTRRWNPKIQKIIVVVAAGRVLRIVSVQLVVARAAVEFIITRASPELIVTVASVQRIPFRLHAGACQMRFLYPRIREPKVNAMNDTRYSHRFTILALLAIALSITAATDEANIKF